MKALFVVLTTAVYLTLAKTMQEKHIFVFQSDVWSGI